MQTYTYRIEYMEIRRVQMTGGSSYVITLPKNWVESLHIKKNDPLGVLIQPDGTLMVTKNINGDQIQRVKEISVDHQTEPEFFLRLLIGTYIAGYSAIRITTKDRIPSQIRVKLREFSSMVIGPECVEETDQSILLKDLLNPLEMPFENSLKRMFVIVKGMHHDAIEFKMPQMALQYLERRDVRDQGVKALDPSIPEIGQVMGIGRADTAVRHLQAIFEALRFTVQHGADAGFTVDKRFIAKQRLQGQATHLVRRFPEKLTVAGIGKLAMQVGIPVGDQAGNIVRHIEHEALAGLQFDRHRPGQLHGAGPAGRQQPGNEGQ